MSNARKPQDHKSKAVDRLRAEAAAMGSDELASMSDREITVVGRSGTLSVRTLEVFDWLGDVMGALDRGDYQTAVYGMVSDQDAARLKAIRPTTGGLIAAFMDDPDDGDLPLGESPASQES